MRVGALPQALCQQLGGGGAQAGEHGFAARRAEVTDGLSLVLVPRGRRHHLFASCEEISDPGRYITFFFFFFHRRICSCVNMRVRACTGSLFRPFLRREGIKVCFLYFNSVQHRNTLSVFKAI